MENFKHVNPDQKSKVPRGLYIQEHAPNGQELLIISDPLLLYTQQRFDISGFHLLFLGLDVFYVFFCSLTLQDTWYIYIFKLSDVFQCRTCVSSHLVQAPRKLQVFFIFLESQVKPHPPPRRLQSYLQYLREKTRC